MSKGKVYKQAIKRVSLKSTAMSQWRYTGDERGRDPRNASLRHYMHKIASANEHILEFVSSLGDSVAVKLTDDERRQLERAG
jgi:hypothetical protein